LNTTALRKLGYGMYVIGSRKGDRFNAQIANTVFQITSDPPIIAVSINKKNLSHEFISGFCLEKFDFSGLYLPRYLVISPNCPRRELGGLGFKSNFDISA